MNSNRRNFISVLNVVACLAVVLLHANGVFWEFSYERYWNTANLIECICYFAVPVFFMNSGVTLIDYRKRYDTKTYVKKRIGKTLIPFFAWSLIGVSYCIISGKVDTENLSLKAVIDSILNTQYVSVYWFFIALFTVYLCIPVLGVIPEEKRKKVFGYVIILSFVLNILYPFLCSFTGIWYNNGIAMPLGNNYLIYVLLGYCMDRYEIPGKMKKAIYGLGLLGFLMHWLGTWYWSREAGEIVQFFKGYLNVPCVLYSSAVFLAVRSLSLPEIVVKISDKVSRLTFGIYLIHWYLLDCILTYTSVNRYSIVYRLLGGVVVFVLSGILTKMIKKVPVVKVLIP